MYILILKLWPSAYIKAFVQIRKEEIKSNYRYPELLSNRAKKTNLN